MLPDCEELETPVVCAEPETPVVCDEKLPDVNGEPELELMPLIP
jgi:hypothetical protein